MWRIQTTLQTVRWRRVPWRLYRTFLPAPWRRRIARLLALPAPGTRGLSIGRVAWLSLKDFFVDDMTTYGAAMAFHLLLALFPFVIFLVTLLSVLHIPGFFDWLVSQVRIMLPIHTMGQVAAAVRQVRTEAHGGLLSIGIIAALWASSAGMRAVMNAVNVAYDVTESRPIWQRYALSLAFTLGFTALVIAAIALMLVGPEAVAALAAHVHAGLDRLVIAVWTWLRIPVSLLLLMLAVALIYYVAPNLEQPFRLLTPGAVLAVVLWLAASFLYSTYVSTFAHYTATYGNIAAIVVLLLYFFISSLALLLGAEVNSVIDCHAPRKRESTRPMAPCLWPQGRNSSCCITPRVAHSQSRHHDQAGGRCPMSVARITEISAISATSFEDAIQQGIARANKTLRNVEGAWIKEQSIKIADGKITGYQVNMQITFVLDD